MSVYPQPPPYQQPVYQQPTTVVVAQPAARHLPGACPLCGGRMSKHFTIWGILIAWCFFPWGIICCFMMRESRCNSCGR